ncbi:HdeD family acid-resistance protein [Streptomyces sp. NBRC 110028]|uniref:HdeD family acid-resistance protein n=1 Tax=Streptomyces sp. NBRC 110028 TaxID=1621260 RepID=UPI0006E1CA0D|nr:HdeD family acid-resistance protein [Streptomyces sp. NBRC 110028]
MTFPSDNSRDAEQRDERAAGPDRPFTGLLGTLSDAAWQMLLTAGLVAIVLGLLVLVWPAATLAVVGALFGVYLLITGIVQLVAAFGAHIPGSMRVLSFVSGAVSVFLGLICFRGPAQSILLLALWIGFAWLLRGVMHTVMAVQDTGIPARGWQIFLGVITALAGIVLIVSPFGSIAALTLVTGVWLLVLGIIEVIHGIQLRARLGGHAPRQAHHGFRFRHQPHPQA